ncbi:MAG: molybdenum cofactor biosynthesis protein MoaE [Chloroflexi bacterium]|nr:molybdenum cofactor biosynthesis protein MoaE [Chloroflexota bacterium]
MQVQVKFFAIFREMVGKKNDAKEIAEGTTVEALWREYAVASPRLGNLRAAYSVNQHLVKGDHVLRDGDEVGFLPPVSGGQVKSKKVKAKSKIRVHSRNSRITKNALITTRRLDLNALVERVEFSGAGAILVFSGVVRDNARGKSVKHLEYEAYPEMAERSLNQIIAEIHERWGDVRVAMAHRVGKLKIGEASLVIAVASPHRPDAYAASRYAIERVKAIVPVWKKEFTLDGEDWVEGPIAGELSPDKAEQIVADAERAHP